MLTRLFVGLQHVVPQRLLSDLVLATTRWRFGPWKNALIRILSRIYAIDLDEPARPAPHGYESFADFFTRELRPGARPLPEAAVTIACPADGKISAMGPVDGDRVFQAKGHDYGLAELLASEDEAARFEDGAFATIYLAPSNYHRVHAPVAGRLVETAYVPGKLFSVSPGTVDHLPGLFARNERLVCLFDSEDFGRVAVILVGAMLVSGIETVWGGAEAHRDTLERIDRTGGDIQLERGDELGRFNMGSTVILLFQRDKVRLERLPAHTVVRMGQGLGQANEPTAGVPGSNGTEDAGQ
ncbi:MAG: archaetidylserine decarboxylase [Pseudomonadota bacterium]